MTTPYGKDIAYIHDDGFGGFALQASKGILDLLQQAGTDQGLIVDLGCGSGIWPEILLREGYEAHGIDISPAMIELARRRAPGATFQVASYLQADIPACSAVTSVGECLNYVVDEDHSDVQLRKLFARVYTALVPGGLFIFDVIGPRYAKVIGLQKRYFISEDWAILVHVTEHKPEQMLKRYLTSFRKTETGLYRREEETHHVRMLKGTHLAGMLREMGFRVRLRKGYGSFRLSPAHSVIIARKP